LKIILQFGGNKKRGETADWKLKRGDDMRISGREIGYGNRKLGSAGSG
jgi:hypothetical protein